MEPGHTRASDKIQSNKELLLIFDTMFTIKPAKPGKLNTMDGSKEVVPEYLLLLRRFEEISRKPFKMWLPAAPACFFFFLMLGHFRFHSLKICHSAFLLLFGKATTCKVFVARSIVQQRGIQEWSEVIEGDKVFEKNSLSLSFRNSVFPVLEVIYMENLEV